MEVEGSICSDSRAVMHIGDICYLHVKARSADVIMKDNQEVSITHQSFFKQVFPNDNNKVCVNAFRAVRLLEPPQ